MSAVNNSSPVRGRAKDASAQIGSQASLVSQLMSILRIQSRAVADVMVTAEAKASIPRECVREKINPL